MPRFLRFLPACAAISLLVTACDDEPEEVIVTETRSITTRDTPPLLNATSDQRFRNAQPSPVIGDAPDHWLALPASQFRDLNFRFGESGFGEVYVTIAAGSELDNVNRWFDQFAAPRVTAAGLAEMRRVPIAGTTGVWIEATGRYNSGMGSPPREGYALAGVIAEIRGRTLTLKMVGPVAEVREQHEALEAVAKSLQLRD
jgi:hypothetical protein